MFGKESSLQAGKNLEYGAPFSGAFFFSIPILNAKVERMFSLMKNGENRFSGTAWPRVRI